MLHGTSCSTPLQSPQRPLSASSASRKYSATVSPVKATRARAPGSVPRRPTQSEKMLSHSSEHTMTCVSRALFKALCNSSSKSASESSDFCLLLALLFCSRVLGSHSLAVLFFSALNSSTSDSFQCISSCRVVLPLVPQLSPSFVHSSWSTLRMN